MSGSRDPIRAYLLEERRHRMYDRIDRIVGCFAVLLSAVIMAVVIWVMLVVILSAA